ncbi:N2,N2-dimethylguanosine tRNA methyltransferas-like protein [Amylocarpus encephaloides]|uniref:tRNA (guanine(26)-N(2))-dimethyltransferase n=1 Tax=Amylocarpus encephaloides TaxID=45428 RepID=A0A9P8C5T0_9HELO|nr:N2,N2-dimethylguanosine tRNA methyltransferas-like protein [Amylocarpus encephaloides]
MTISNHAIARYVNTKLSRVVISFCHSHIHPSFFSTMAPLPDITTVPAADQHILHNGKEYTTVKEGLAHILVPSSAPKVPQATPQGSNQPQSVFYNPIQQFNRDLSVLAIKAYGENTLEKKTMILEKSKQRLNVKRKEKKRKRENDDLVDSSRKAGKLDTTTEADSVAETDPKEPPDGANTVAIELDSTMDIGDPKAVVETGIYAENGGEPEKGEGLKKGNEPNNGEKIENDGPATDSLEASAIDGQKQTNDDTNTDHVPVKPFAPKQPSFTILDALSATGLRALRYANEIPFTTSVTANDLLPDATKNIKMNVQHNKLGDKIQAITGNALAHMYNVACGDSKRKYDVIDLDPYGTAAPFLDAAVQSVREDGGLLCVTCTDAGVWASNGYPEKAFSLYGGIPIKGPQSHEGGLRLILHAIATSAAKYGLAMEPLLSLSIDFYARVFVKIHKSPADVKFLAGTTMVVYNCDTGCGAWTTQMLGKNKLAPNKSGKGHFWKHVFALAPSATENCQHCGMKTHLAGPMYAGPLHSPDFIKRILNSLPDVSSETYNTYSRIEGMLSTALEEVLPPKEENANSPTATWKTKRYDPATIDHYPFFFIPSSLAKVVHCITPHENALRGALRHLGYRTRRSHTKGGCIKTDAPWHVVWEIMREWVKQKAPIREGAVRKDTAGYKILRLGETQEGSSQTTETVAEKDQKTKAKIEVIFDENLGKDIEVKKLVRYQLNPRENWGPMNRASGKE